MSSMSITSAMTLAPIAIQTPMKTIFGQKACFVYWVSNQMYLLKTTTSGAGMAVYRLLCFQFLYKRNLNTKTMVRKIRTAEWMVILGVMASFATSFYMYGWDKSILYQYCMDEGHEKVEILHQYNIQEYNNFLFKALQVIPGTIIRSLILLELLIYLWIIYHLWKHDKENCEQKVITQQMRNQRNHKNIITLKGQIITFVIEIVYFLYIAVHTFDSAFVDASVMPMSLIIISTVTSVVQILTSHEMMRFLKSYFNF